MSDFIEHTQVLNILEFRLTSIICDFKIMLDEIASSFSSLFIKLALCHWDRIVR